MTRKETSISSNFLGYSPVKQHDCDEIAKHLDPIRNHVSWIADRGDDSDADSNETTFAALKRRYLQGYYTIIPEDNRILDLWDLLVISAILLTATVLPFDVAFYTSAPKEITLLMSIVDAVFVSDMFVTFQVGYTIPNALTHEWYERKPNKIARHYMAFPCSKNFTAGWFWPDLLTVFPWDWFGCKTVRFLRVLRLVRMVRLVRVIRLIGRWHSRLGTSYALLNVLKCAMMTLFALHWLSCIWGHLGMQTLNLNQPSWLQNYGGKFSFDVQGYSEFDVYNLAMYFCAMTLTGVGFGDIYPNGQFEIKLSTMTMFATGFMWAWVIANIVNVVSNLEGYDTCFQQLNDDLNMLMDSRSLPTNLRTRARKHLHESYKVQRQRHQMTTIRALSNGLQGEIAIESGGETVCNCVWYLRNLPGEVLTDLVNYLIPDMYGPAEYIIHKQTVSVIRRGCCWHKGRMLVRDDVIGEDMLLDSEHLRETIYAKTLNYVEVMSLSRSDLSLVCDRFPDFSKKVRLAQIKFALLRGLIYTARQLKRKTSPDPMKNLRRTAPRFCRAQDRFFEITAMLIPMNSVLNKVHKELKYLKTPLLLDQVEVESDINIFEDEDADYVPALGVRLERLDAAMQWALDRLRYRPSESNGGGLFCRSRWSLEPFEGSGSNSVEKQNACESDPGSVGDQGIVDETIEMGTTVQPPKSTSRRHGQLEQGSFLDINRRLVMLKDASCEGEQSFDSKIVFAPPLADEVCDAVARVLESKFQVIASRHDDFEKTVQSIEKKIEGQNQLLQSVFSSLSSCRSQRTQPHDDLERAIQSIGRKTEARNISSDLGSTREAGVDCKEIDSRVARPPRPGCDFAEFSKQLDDMLEKRHETLQTALAGYSAKIDAFWEKTQAQLIRIDSNVDGTTRFRETDPHGEFSTNVSFHPGKPSSSCSPCSDVPEVASPVSMRTGNLQQQVSAQMESDHTRLLTTVRHRGMNLEAAMSAQLTEFGTKLRERAESQMKTLRETLLAMMRRHGESMRVGYTLSMACSDARAGTSAVSRLNRPRIDDATRLMRSDVGQEASPADRAENNMVNNDLPGLYRRRLEAIEISPRAVSGSPIRVRRHSAMPSFKTVSHLPPTQ